MSATYTLTLSEKSRCPDCGLRPSLLAHVHGKAPAFYLCDCGFIGQVGKGPVRSFGKRNAARVLRLRMVADLIEAGGAL